jgi:tripartite-type tricarboxylate transporter receptor subunit TctC
MNAVPAGEVDLSFISAPVAMTQAKANKVRALGVTSAEPLAMWPDLPPLAAQGLKGFDVSAWFGLVAPAKTPQPTLEKIHQAVSTALQAPAVKEALRQQGMVVTPGPRMSFAGSSGAKLSAGAQSFEPLARRWFDRAPSS